MCEETEKQGVCSECWIAHQPLFVRGISTICGKYYHGPPICQRCMNKHREEGIAVLEAETVQAKGKNE